MSRAVAAEEPPLLAPRPNPGPEPWPSSPGPGSWWLLALLPVAALGWWLARKRRVAAAEADLATSGGPVDPSPPVRLVRLAERIREALATRFGPSWFAKSTEEISESLDGVVAPPVREPLLLLLREADLAKFSDRGVVADHFLEIETEAEAALGAFAAEGATSIQNGR